MSIGKSKSKPAPPSAEFPPLFPAISALALTLFPLVIVNSGPATPLVSCHPKGEAIAFAGSETNASVPWLGLSIGIAKTR